MYVSVCVRVCGVCVCVCAVCVCMCVCACVWCVCVILPPVAHEGDECNPRGEEKEEAVCPQQGEQGHYNIDCEWGRREGERECAANWP